jgi:hypothetical protein
MSRDLLTGHRPIPELPRADRIRWQPRRGHPGPTQRDEQRDITDRITTHVPNHPMTHRLTSSSTRAGDATDRTRPPHPLTHSIWRYSHSTR